MGVLKISRKRLTKNKKKKIKKNAQEDKNQPVLLGDGGWGWHARSPVIYSDTSQSWVSVSSCTQKWVDSAFLWECYAISWCRMLKSSSKRCGRLALHASGETRGNKPSSSLVCSCRVPGKALWWVGTGHEKFREQNWGKKFVSYNMGRLTWHQPIAGYILLGG